MLRIGRLTLAIAATVPAIAAPPGVSTSAGGPLASRMDGSDRLAEPCLAQVRATIGPDYNILLADVYANGRNWHVEGWVDVKKNGLPRIPGFRCVMRDGAILRIDNWRGGRLSKPWPARF